MTIKYVVYKAKNQGVFNSLFLQPYLEKTPADRMQEKHFNLLEIVGSRTPFV